MEEYDIYGAVGFHSLVEGEEKDRSSTRGSKLLTKMRAHLKQCSSCHPWLKHKVGFFHRFEITEPVGGYEELYVDGTVKSISRKDQFAFSPGLVLMGGGDDIETVPF